MVTLVSVRNLVEGICRTDTPDFVSGALDTYSQAALAIISRDKPYNDVEDVTGSGANLQATPSSWVDGSSTIARIVYPYVDEDSNVLDPDTYFIDSVPVTGVPVEKIRMSQTPAATATVRVWYTRPYASETEILAQDEIGFAYLVASIIVSARADYFLVLKDQGMTADLVDYGSKAIEARAQAIAHFKLYRRTLGLPDKEGPVPAAVAGDVDTDPQYYPYLSHQRHHRNR